jgi:glycosyltransferase involved in cell wall biosynthesis
MSRVSPCSSWKRTVCDNPAIGGRTGGIPEAIVDGKGLEPESVANIAERLATIPTDHELAAAGRGGSIYGGR